MTQEQIKQKARDYAQSEFNNDYSKLDEQGKTAFHFLERGYSMALRNLNNQCFDLMRTGSLPMTREDMIKWADEQTADFINGSAAVGFNSGAKFLYDHLASISIEAPARVGVRGEAVNDFIEKGQEKAAVEFSNHFDDKGGGNVFDLFEAAYNRGANELLDYLQGTAPVSSAAQPATGYSEERGHSTNPNVQEKASIQPPLSAPEWLNKHNSGG